MSKPGTKFRIIDYIDSLDSVSRSRYVEKLNLIDGTDPYKVPPKEWISNPECLPGISYPDIVNYLVFQVSAFTLDDFKSYKALDSYKWVVLGWVKEVRSLGINKRILVTSRVSVWIVVLSETYTPRGVLSFLLHT